MNYYDSTSLDAYAISQPSSPLIIIPPQPREGARRTSTFITVIFSARLIYSTLGIIISDTLTFGSVLRMPSFALVGVYNASDKAEHLAVCEREKIVARFIGVGVVGERNLCTEKKKKSFPPGFTTRASSLGN